MERGRVASVLAAVWDALQQCGEARAVLGNRRLPELDGDLDSDDVVAIDLTRRGEPLCGVRVLSRGYVHFVLAPDDCREYVGFADLGEKLELVPVLVARYVAARLGTAIRPRARSGGAAQACDCVAAQLRLPVSAELLRACTLAGQRAVVVTGGASGADAAWAEGAVACGVPVVVASFAGHRAVCPRAALVVRISTDELDAFSDSLDATMSTLRRAARPARRSRVWSLLTRNLALASVCDVLVAAGHVSGSAPGLGVGGGTAYACEAYVERCKSTGRCATLYVFDEGSSGWLARGGDGCGWTAVGAPTLALLTARAGAPSGRPAIVGAVGSRELSAAGRSAIWDVFATEFADAIE